MPTGTDKPTIYFIPGLAATSLIFRNIKLPDYPVVHFEWENPQPGDDMNSYATRMLQQIDQSKPFVLIGCSLGGIMSIEIAKISQPKQVFLISSMEESREFPWYLKMWKYIPVYKLIPFAVFRWAIKLYRPLAGGLSKKEADAFQTMLDQFPGKFFNWAMHQVLHWKQTQDIPNVYHIHGDKDGLFPIRLKKRVDLLVKGGNHFMVVNKGRQIAHFLLERLESDSPS